METIELLTRFADPEIMKTLSLTDRLMAGLITTILGMGITCVSLIILQLVIVLMARLSITKPAKLEQSQSSTQVTTAVAEMKDRVDAAQDEEIVAAITATLALQLKTSVSNIRIRNIERVEDSSSAWRKAGIAEQMNNAL